MIIRCKNCGSEINIKSAEGKKIKIKKGNPSFYFKCPFCGATNHIKCRHESGKKKKITIVAM